MVHDFVAALLLDQHFPTCSNHNPGPASYAVILVTLVKRDYENKLFSLALLSLTPSKALNVVNVMV